MVTINGKPTDAAGMTLDEYLSKEGLPRERIACEVNETIVPKCKYGETVLKDGDRVEIVRFVGGG